MYKVGWEQRDTQLLGHHWDLESGVWILNETYNTHSLCDILQDLCDFSLAGFVFNSWGKVSLNVSVINGFLGSSHPSTLQVCTTDLEW